MFKFQQETSSGSTDLSLIALIKNTTLTEM